MRWLDGLATALVGAAIPYGYTLVVWSTGSLVAERHGAPDGWDVAVFAAGAVAAFGLMRLLAGHGEVKQVKGIGRVGVLRAGFVQATSIAVAIGAAAAVSKIAGIAAWALASFLATLLYLVGIGLNEARELWLQHD